MENDKKKSKKKVLIFGSLAVLLIVITVAVTYKTVFVKPEGEISGTVYADIRDDIKPVDVTPTPIEDKPVYVMDVDEVLNSQPVVTEVTPVPDEAADNDVDVPQEVEKQEETVEKQDTEIDSGSEKVSESNPEPKEKKEEEVVVIDESPKTIKEDNVKEYTGGEKTGTGNDFMDLMPEKEPSGPSEDASTGTSGEQVGTWN